MSQGVPKRELDDVCEVEYGTRVVQKRDGGKIYPVYGGGGATFAMDSFNRENRVVISRFGMSEQCTRYVSGKFFLNDSGLTLASKNPSTLQQEFINKWAFGVNAEIFKLGKGTAQKNLDVDAFRRMQVPIPPLSEQKRIVAVLEKAFSAVAKAKENTEKNLANARELFENALQSVFTPHGPGWDEKKLGDLATFRNGINFTKSSRGDSVKIIGVKDFQKLYWAPLDNLDTITTDGTLPASDMLKENDLLFVRSNGNKELIGRCILLGSVAGRITYSGFTIRARLNDNEVMPEYLCHFLKSKKARREMIDSGIGTNIKSLNQTTLSALIIPYPSRKEQGRIVKQLETIKSETQRLESIYKQKLSNLEELKKSILQKAFSGELAGVRS